LHVRGGMDSFAANATATGQIAYSLPNNVLLAAAAQREQWRYTTEYYEGAVGYFWCYGDTVWSKERLKPSLLTAIFFPETLEEQTYMNVHSTASSEVFAGYGRGRGEAITSKIGFSLFYGTVGSAQYFYSYYDRIFLQYNIVTRTAPAEVSPDNSKKFFTNVLGTLHGASIRAGVMREQAEIGPQISSSSSPTPLLPDSLQITQKSVYQQNTVLLVECFYHAKVELFPWLHCFFQPAGFITILLSPDQGNSALTRQAFSLTLGVNIKF
jgi:hypothetical protein